MKILLTGATGFLGGRLCAALLADGHSVRALVRPTSDLSSLPPPAAHGGALDLAYGDVTDYRSLLDAASGCHAVFHAAALVEPWLPDPSKFISVNVGGLKNVLQAARETKSVEKIVYTSSFFALGPTDGHVADESQVHHEKFFCTEYEKSKLLADGIARQAASEGLPIVMVYPGVIYGPGKLTTGNVVAQLLIERFNGRLPGYVGYGSDKYSFSHVEDVVQGHIAAMHQGRPGERYLLTGENASFMHVFDMAAIITGTKRPSFNIPLWMVNMYGWVLVFFSRITGKLPLISPPLIERFNGRFPGYVGDGSDKYSFSHVEDVVQGHIAAMHRGRPGERYLLTGENASFMHVFDMAAIIAGTKRPSFNIPLWMVNMYGWVLVFFSRITGKLPLISPPTVQVLRHQWAYSCDKAKVELDYKPRSLREGLEIV